MVTDVSGQKRDKKTPVCEIVVWPFTFWSKTTLKKKQKKTWFERSRYGHCQIGSKTWTPASVVHKTSPYWWMADAEVRIVAFPIAANTMVRNGRGQIQDFFSWCRRQTYADVKKETHISGNPEGKIFKKSEFAPSILRPCICGNPEGNNLPAPVVYQLGGSFDGPRTPALKFLPSILPQISRQKQLQYYRERLQTVQAKERSARSDVGAYLREQQNLTERIRQLETRTHSPIPIIALEINGKYDHTHSYPNTHILQNLTPITHTPQIPQNRLHERTFQPIPHTDNQPSPTPQITTPHIPRTEKRSYTSAAISQQTPEKSTNNRYDHTS